MRGARTSVWKYVRAVQIIHMVEEGNTWYDYSRRNRVEGALGNRAGQPLNKERVLPSSAKVAPIFPNARAHT